MFGKKIDLFKRNVNVEFKQTKLSTVIICLLIEKDI